MTPITVIQAIMAAVAAAPKVTALVVSAKEFITQMFNAGLITKEVQDASFLYVESVVQAALAGIIPPAFQVEPDPE